METTSLETKNARGKIPKYGSFIIRYKQVFTRYFRIQRYGTRFLLDLPGQRTWIRLGYYLSYSVAYSCYTFFNIYNLQYIHLVDNDGDLISWDSDSVTRKILP